MDALVLLEQWQGEHERNEHGLHQYAKQKDLLLRALKERTIATQDLQEETVGIKKKTVESAGPSALQLQLIEQEEQEAQVLDGEISRLTKEVRLKEAELERRGLKNHGPSDQASVAQRLAGNALRQSDAYDLALKESLQRASCCPCFQNSGAIASAGGDRGQIMDH